MFDTRLYKQSAKNCLKGRRTVACLVSLCIILIESSLSAGSFSNSVEQSKAAFNYTINVSNTNYLFLAITCFVFGVLGIAEVHFYLNAIKDSAPLKFSTFIDGCSLWLKGFMGFAWKWLWLTLWSMLFIIPGIVKFFAYSQMFYILEEYPSLGVAKALKISIEITKGHKAELFWMQLSFLGWYILSAFTGGILLIWVRPYVKTSFTFAYKALMQRALQSGAITQEDLQG